MNSCMKTKKKKELRKKQKFVHRPFLCIFKKHDSQYRSRQSRHLLAETLDSHSTQISFKQD